VGGIGVLIGVVGVVEGVGLEVVVDGGSWGFVSGAGKKEGVMAASSVGSGSTGCGPGKRLYEMRAQVPKTLTKIKLKTTIITITVLRLMFMR
jgi:hypothetical protein